MKKIIQYIYQYIKKHKVISVVILVIVLIAGYYIYAAFHKATTPTSYVFGKVQRGDLVVTVSGSGQASTLSKVEIKPQTTGQTQTLGQILKVNVINGQTVKAGDVIATLDGKSALQAVNQARASVVSAQATYNKLVNGPTASDLQSNQSSVQNANISFQNATLGVDNGLQSAYITASGIVFVNTDSFFTNPLVLPKLNIADTYYSDQSLQTKVENERTQVGYTLDDWKKELANISSSTDRVAIANDGIAKLTIIRNYFDDMTTLFALDGQSVSSAGQINLNTDKSAAASARSTINSAITSLTSTLQSYQTASANLQQSNTSLSLKIAPPNTDDVAVAKAQLDNAKANLANAQDTYASRIIIAPFDGQIGGLTAQVGQQISSSDVLGTIITSQKVVNISLNEVDAAKVTAGDPVVLTFDAIPNLTIPGTVSYLDPLGTVSQGVVNYSVQIKLNVQNDQIKTGMTASATITTATQAGVLMVPTTAISKVGNRSVVLVPNDANTITFASSTRSRSFASSTASSTPTTTFASVSGSYTDTQVSVHPVMVTVGISNEASTEIVSGLDEGQVVVVRTIKGTTTSTATTARATGSLFSGGGGGATARIGR